MKLSCLTSPILGGDVTAVSETRHLMTRHSFPFLRLITAVLLKMMVFVLCLGWVSLEKTSPTMKAWMRQPRTAWRDITIMASEHWVVVCRVP